MQKIYLDIIEEDVNSQRRFQKGMYTSYYIGDKQRVKLILLDVRYFRDTYVSFISSFDDG